MTNYLKENERFLVLFHEFKLKRGLESDYAAAKVLGIPRQTLSNYRKGNSRPDAYACTRLAVECGYDPITLIAELEAAKGEKGARGAFWRDFFRLVRPGGFVPALMCGVFLLVASVASDKTHATSDVKAHYTKRRRWLGLGLVRAFAVRRDALSTALRGYCVTPVLQGEKRQGVAWRLMRFHRHDATFERRPPMLNLAEGFGAFSRPGVCL